MADAEPNVPLLAFDPTSSVGVEQAPARQGPWSWTKDTAIDLARGFVGTAGDIAAGGGDKAYADFASDLAYRMGRAKSERGQYVERHPSESKGGIIDDIAQAAIGLTPYVPLAVGSEAAGALAAPFTGGISAVAAPAATFAGLSYGAMRRQVREAIRFSPEVEKSPRYQELVSGGLSDKEARDKLYDESDRLIPGLLAAGAGAVGGGIGTAVINKLVGKAASGAVADAVTNRVLERMGGQYGPAALTAKDVAVPGVARRMATTGAEAYGAGVAQMGGVDIAAQMAEQPAGITPDYGGAMASAFKQAAPFAVFGGLGGVRRGPAGQFQDVVRAGERQRAAPPREAPPIGTEQTTALSDQLNPTEPSPVGNQTAGQAGAAPGTQGAGVGEPDLTDFRQRRIAAATAPGPPPPPPVAPPDFRERWRAANYPEPDRPIDQPLPPEAPFPPAAPHRPGERPVTPEAPLPAEAPGRPAPPSRPGERPFVGEEPLPEEAPFRRAQPRPGGTPLAERLYPDLGPATTEPRPTGRRFARGVTPEDIYPPGSLEHYQDLRNQRVLLGEEIARRQHGLDEDAARESGLDPVKDRDELDDYIEEHDHLRQEGQAVQKMIDSWDRMGDEVAQLRQAVVDRRRGKEPLTAAGKAEAKAKAERPSLYGVKGEHILSDLGIEPLRPGSAAANALEAANIAGRKTFTGKMADVMAQAKRLAEGRRKIQYGKRPEGRDEALWREANKEVMAKFAETKPGFLDPRQPEATKTAMQNEFMAQRDAAYERLLQQKYRVGEAEVAPKLTAGLARLRARREAEEAKVEKKPAWQKPTVPEAEPGEIRGERVEVKGVGAKGRKALETAEKRRLGEEQRRKEVEERLEEAVTAAGERAEEQARQRGVMQAIAGVTKEKQEKQEANVAAATGRTRKQEKNRREYVELDRLAQEAVEHPEHQLDEEALQSTLGQLARQKGAPSLARMHAVANVFIASAEARLNHARAAIQKWRDDLTASGMKPGIRYGLTNRSTKALYRNVLVHYNDFIGRAKSLIEKGDAGRKQLDDLIGDFYSKERQILAGDVLGFNDLEKHEKEALRAEFAAARDRAIDAKPGEEGHLNEDQLSMIEDAHEALDRSLEQDEDDAYRPAHGNVPSSATELAEEQRLVSEAGQYAKGRVPWALGQRDVLGSNVYSPLVYARVLLDDLLPRTADKTRAEKMAMVRDRLAEITKRQRINRERDLADVHKDETKALAEVRERQAEMRSQALIEAEAPEERLAREQRQGEGQHYYDQAFEDARSRGLSEELAIREAEEERRDYHTLSPQDRAVLEDYENGHVNSLFDGLSIAQKIDWQKRYRADLEARAKAVGAKDTAGFVAKFMAERGNALVDRMQQLWRAVTLVRPDLDLTARPVIGKVGRKASLAERDAAKNKLWQIHQDIRRAMGEAPEPFVVKQRAQRRLQPGEQVMTEAEHVTMTDAEAQKILNTIHADLGRASGAIERIDDTMRLHWETMGLGNLPEYGIRDLLDAATDLSKPAALPKGAHTTKVRDMFGPTSSTYGLQAGIRGGRAELIRHFMRVANKLVGGMDVVHLTDEQMGIAAQERNLPATVRAFYDPQSDRIFITHDAFQSGDRGRLMVHEVAHALTESAMQRFPQVVQRMEEIRRQLKMAFNNENHPANQAVRDALDGNDHGLNNVHEFISEFWANDRYADALAAVETGEKQRLRWKTEARKETLLGRMVEAVRTALERMFYDGSQKRMLNDATVAALDMLQRLEDKGRPRPYLTGESAARATQGDNAVKGSFFHGTPFDYAQDQYRPSPAGIQWLTKSPRVAQEYSTGQPMGAQRGSGARKPQVFRVDVDAKNVFDTRKPEHRALYDEIRTESLEHPDPDEHLPKLGADESLPSFGKVSLLKDYLMARGFDGAWAGEGSQGNSLALFHPEIGRAHPAPARPYEVERLDMSHVARSALGRAGDWVTDAVRGISNDFTKMGTARNLAHHVGRFDKWMEELLHRVTDVQGKTDREHQRLGEVHAPLLRRLVAALNMGDPKIVDNRMAKYVMAENYAKAVGNAEIGKGENSWIDPTNPEHIQHIERHKAVKADWDLPEEQGGFKPEQKAVILELRKVLRDVHNEGGRLSFADIMRGTNLLHEQTPLAVEAAYAVAKGRKLTPEQDAELKAQVTDEDAFKAKIKEWKRVLPQLRELQGVFYPMVREGDTMVHGTYDVERIAKDAGLNYDASNSPEPADEGRALKFRFANETDRDAFIRHFSGGDPDHDFHFTAAGKEAEDKTPYATINNQHFSGHDTEREAENALAVLRSDKYFTSGGPSVRRASIGFGSPLRQLGGLNRLVEGMKNSAYYRDLPKDEQGQIERELHEQAVRYMLNESARSKYLERRYTKGADDNLLNNVFKYLHNTSYTLAELKLRPEMRTAVKAVDDYVDQSYAKEPPPNMDVALSQRYNLNRTKAQRSMHERLAVRPEPHNSGWLDKTTTDIIRATNLAKLGGFSFHVLNSTEPTMLALPNLAGTLSAKYGSVVGDAKAANYFRRAYALYGFDRIRDMAADLKKVLTSGFDGVEGLSDHLKSIRERVQNETDGDFLARGMDFLHDTGYLHRDAGFDLAKFFDPRQRTFLGSRILGKVFDKVDDLNRSVGSAVEAENRVVTATAALWASKDMHPEWTDQQHFRFAQQLVEKSAGNYAWYNKPAWMQSKHPLARMATQFRNYPLRVTQNYALMTMGAYHYLRRTDVANPEAHEANRVLARQLLRQTLSQVAWTGLRGTALWGVAGAVASGLSPITGVNSDRAEDYMRAGLADIMGPEWAEFWMSGGLRMLGSDTPGTGIGERLSHSNLWFQGALGEKEDDWYRAFGHLLGGAASDTVFQTVLGAHDLTTGLRRIADGQETAGQDQAWRGLQEVLPVKAFADAIKTLTTDEKTPAGAPKAPPRSTAQLVSNLLGLRTAGEAERSEHVGAWMRTKKEYDAKVLELKRGYAVGSADERQNIRANLQFFNEGLPSASRVTAMDLERYRRGYEKKAQTPAEQLGVTLSKRDKPMFEQLSSAYTH